MKTTSHSRWEKRYICWALPILFVIFETANLMIALSVANDGAFDYARVEMSTMISRDADAAWMSETPEGQDWPSPTETEIYRKVGRRAYVYESKHEDAYADSPSSEPSYMMTILRGGFPFAAVEYKRCTIWQDESVIQAFPPTNKMPLRWKATGLILNPLIFAIPVWLLFSVLPIAIWNKVTSK